MISYPKVKLLDPGQIKVPDFQREEVKRHKGLKGGYDPRKAGALTVAEEGDGDYVVIDGQQRMAAAKKDGYKVHCCVIQNVDYYDQIKLFLEINQGRAAVNKGDQAHALCERGDAAMTALREVLRGHGLLRGEKKDRMPADVAGFMAHWMGCPIDLGRAVVLEMEASQKRQIRALDSSLTCLERTGRGKLIFRLPIMMGVADLFFQDKYDGVTTESLAKALKKKDVRTLAVLHLPVGEGRTSQGAGFRLHNLDTYVKELAEKFLKLKPKKAVAVWP